MNNGAVNVDKINTPSTPRFNTPNAPNQNRAVSLTAGAQMMEASVAVHTTDTGDTNPGTDTSSEETEIKETNTLTPRWKPLTADEVQLLIQKHKEVCKQGRPMYVEQAEGRRARGKSTWIYTGKQSWAKYLDEFRRSL
eukprot:Nk52_evm1s794 gene=Nk52_evmTU1s794